MYNEPTYGGGGGGGGGGGVWGAAASLAMFAYTEAMRKSNERRQMQMQKELNADAAALNYEYGERSAENAHMRALEMNKLTYEQNSPLARKEQMEAAGLNVGLMYSGGATQAGGAGSAGTAAQGQGAGGQQGGRAPSATEMQAVKLQGMQMALQMEQIAAQIKLTKAQAENVGADTGAKRAQTKTVEDMRDTLLENAKQQGKGQWLQNLRDEYVNEKAAGAPESKREAEIEIFGNKIYGSTAIANNSFFSVGEAEELAKLQEERQLVNKQNKYYWRELLNGIMSANANQVKAGAERLAAEHKTGEFTNWKTWVDVGINVVSAFSKMMK